MKIWNRSEYDNGKIGLIVSGRGNEMSIDIDGVMYQVESSEPTAQGDKELVVVCPIVVPDLIETLDSGFVRYVDHMGDDLSIVRSARVSYDADWREGDQHKKNSDEKLIRYLLMNGHTSPFEAVQFTFELKMPIFIARQWHRHRTWSYNEVSARYTELDMGFYLPDPLRIGVQSKDNKQVREFPDVIDDETLDVNKILVHRMESQMNMAWTCYEQLIEGGVPTELARLVLPVASYTRFFGTVNLHNLFHFLQLRLHAHAQWEIREYAEAILAIIEPRVPVAVQAFKEKIGYGDSSTT